MMTVKQQEWIRAREELKASLSMLGFPAELGDEIAKNLGSPKAMRRMTAYLDMEKPERIETVVDEMLAIRTEIEAWRRKKASEEANEAYNEMLDYFGNSPEEE